MTIGMKKFQKNKIANPLMIGSMKNVLTIIIVGMVAEIGECLNVAR